MPGQQGREGNATIPQLREALFYLALTIELMLVIVDKSRLQNLYVSYFFRATFLLTLIVVLLTDYTRRQWLCIGLFCALGLVSYRISGRNDLLRFFIFIAACREIDMKRAIRYTFLLTLAGCILLALLSVTGIYGELSITQDFGHGIGEETRYTLGFGHPNALHGMCFMLILLTIYIYNDKMKWYHYLLLLALNVGVYLLTRSRTAFAVTAFSVLLAALAHSVKRLRLRHAAAGMAAVLAGVGFSVWAAAYSHALALHYDSLAGRLDTLLTNRLLSLYWYTSTHEGALETWRLFSDRTSQEYFDMGWVRLFYWYGILPGTVLLLTLLLLICACYRYNDRQGLVWIVCISLYTVTEAHVISPYIGRNYLLLLYGAYWYRAHILNRGPGIGIADGFYRHGNKETRDETGSK